MGNWLNLLGPVVSILTVIGLVGFGVGTFAVQRNKGTAEARNNLLTEQQTSIAYLEGEVRRLREQLAEAHAQQQRTDQKAAALQASFDALRALVNLEVVPKGVQQALDEQARVLLAGVAQLLGTAHAK